MLKIIFLLIMTLSCSSCATHQQAPSIKIKHNNRYLDTGNRKIKSTPRIQTEKQCPCYDYEKLKTWKGEDIPICITKSSLFITKEIRASQNPELIEDSRNTFPVHCLERIF